MDQTGLLKLLNPLQPVPHGCGLDEGKAEIQISHEEGEERGFPAIVQLTRLLHIAPTDRSPRSTTHSAFPQTT